MERSGTSEEEYCSVLPQLSTITAVKHDREVAVEFVMRNCSREAEGLRNMKFISYG